MTMPWTSVQLPWSSFKYTPPPRPSGIDEPLNWMKGPPILNKFSGINTYGAPSKLTSNPVRLYGAPAILAGARLRGGSK